MKWKLRWLVFVLDDFKSAFRRIEKYRILLGEVNIDGSVDIDSLDVASNPWFQLELHSFLRGEEFFVFRIVCPVVDLKILQFR